MGLIRRKYNYTCTLSDSLLRHICTLPKRSRCSYVFKLDVDLWNQRLTLTTADTNKYTLRFTQVYCKDEPSLEPSFDYISITDNGASINLKTFRLSVPEFIQLWLENQQTS